MLDRANAVLLVIDYQDSLLAKIPRGDEIVGRAVKLIRVFQALDAPVFWTEQYRKGLGPTRAAVAEALSGQSPVDKLTFGCFGVPEFAQAVERTQRRQLVLVGIETHVCVLQTALEALALGYAVRVVRDAAGSRAQEDYEAALARMQARGVEIVTMEMVIFELLRAAGTPEFKKILPLIK